MGAELTFQYQQDADILVIAQCPSYIGQDENEIDDLVCARSNLCTGEIESIEIVFFESRLKRKGEITLPVDTGFSVAGSVAPDKPARTRASEGPLILKYDQPSDSLNLFRTHPYPEQRSRQVAQELFAGLNPDTEEIERLEIRSFKARMERDGQIVLPIEATLRLAERAVVTD